MIRLARAIIVICAGALIGACGIKGPLYLPNAPKDATWPVKPPLASDSARARFETMSDPGRSTAPFARRADYLYCEDLALEELAQRFGTPLYVYSRRAILDAYQQYVHALGGRPSLVCYAVK